MILEICYEVCGDAVKALGMSFYFLGWLNSHTAMKANRITWPGMIATILMIGGVGWGLFLALLLAESFTSLEKDGARLFLVSLVLGPGYLVTIGYGYRTYGFPSLIARQCFWLTSFLVQGAWLLAIGLPAIHDVGLNIASLWWIFATATSVVALLSEPKEAPWQVND